MRRRRGKKPAEVILVPVDPVRQRRLRVLAGVAVPVALAVVFLFGQLAAERADRDALAERDRLRHEHRQLSTGLQAAREELALHRSGAEMTTQAQEQLRQELRGLRDQIAELEEAVAFYKSVMSPGSGDDGLRIERFQLSRGQEDGVYHYRLVLTQVADNRNFVAGTVTLSIEGIRDGESVTVQTENLLDDASDTRFRFRYFQELSGQFRLDDGLTPQQIRVEAATTGRGAQRVEQQFGWQLQERDGAWAG